MANVNENDLAGLISAALHTRLARVLLIEGVVDDDATSMRIWEEFLALRSELLTAAVFYCPPAVELSPMDVVNKQMLQMKKENLAQAKENKRNLLREKELAKIKLPLHEKCLQKLYCS